MFDALFIPSDFALRGHPIVCPINSSGVRWVYIRYAISNTCHEPVVEKIVIVVVAAAAVFKFLSNTSQGLLNNPDLRYITQVCSFPIHLFQLSLTYVKILMVS